MSTAFKKMAGTSAVFVFADYAGPSPVERDGMIWQAEELHIQELPATLQEKPAMANALALEGLEEYDPPSHGDKRFVNSLGVTLAYNQRIRGWVQIT